MNLNRRDKAEFVLKVWTLGLLTAISHRKISLEDAQKALFRVGAIEQLEKLGIDDKHLKVVWAAIELEDVADLVPHEFQNEVNKLIDSCLENFEFNALDTNINNDFIGHIK